MNPADSTPEASDRQRIRKEASEWIVKRDLGFNAQEQDRFFEWMARSPQHAEAYAAMQAVFKRMDVMVQWRPLHALEPNPDLLAPPRARRRGPRMLPWIGGLAAALALGLAWWQTRPTDAPLPPVHLIAGDTPLPGERHTLGDGSVIVLNRGAQVAVRFEPRRRVLDLVAGEAYFEVAEDKNRPFVVRIGGAAVTALGTEFNIALISDRLEVLVTKGRVRVDPPPAATPAPREVPALAQQIVDAGQAVVVSTVAPDPRWLVETYTPERVAQKIAWKNDLVDFRSTPLSDVILEFNRRHPTQLVIGEAPLRALPVTGTLRMTNLEGFLELLSVTHGIHSERQGTTIVLRRTP